MQLLRITKEKTFEIVQETLDHISTFDGGIAIVAIAGKTRTGKSSILNRLLGLKYPNIFKVSSNVDAFTKGLWIWSVPLFN